MKSLTPQQILMAGLVAQGMPVAKAARKMLVPARTARGWAARPDFKAAVAAERAEILAETAGRLRGGLPRALNRLVRLMGSSDEAIAMRATTEFFNQAIRLGEHVDLARQISELKEIIDRAKPA